MASSPDWFRDSFRSEYDKQDAALGRFTLAIFGKTGVGKSTLINAIFGEEVARTGIGEPVTRGSHLYLDKIGHLGIVDTQGLEVGRDSKEILSELGKAMAQMRRLPLSEQIHVAWYCVRGMDRRFEDTEADFVRRLDEMGLPVLVVLTQVPRRWDAETGRGHFHPDAVLLAEQIMARRLPIAGGRPVHDLRQGRRVRRADRVRPAGSPRCHLSRCARRRARSARRGAADRLRPEGGRRRGST